MAAKNMQILAVVVVVVVVAAGAGTFLFLNNNHNDKATGVKLDLLNSELSPTLEVYGNVNEDLVIDEKDVQALQKAIEENKTADYKYADANFDGVVNADDVTYINKIINASLSDPVEIKHIQRYTNGDYYLKEGRSTTIPTNAVCATAAANMLTMFKHIGILDEIKCVAWYSAVDPVLLSDYTKFFCDKTFSKDGTGSYTYRVGGSAGYFSEELLTNHINNDHITAIITADNASSYLSGASKSYTYGITEDKAYELGLDVIRVAPASSDFESFLSDLALLALVTGKATSKIATLETWLESTIGEINTKLTENVKNGGDMKQVAAAATSMATYSKSSDGTVSTYNYISSKTSDYSLAVMGAGGKFVMDSYDFKGSSSSAKMEDLGKWLSEYPIDDILIYKTGSGFSWYKGEASTQDVVKGCALAFSDSEPYYNNNVYVLSGDMPVILRTIYAATIMYNSLFSKDWADGKNVDYSTTFLGLSEETVKAGQYYVTMSDLGLKGH